MNIKKLRQSKKWTQAELALKLGVSINSVRAWEKGFSPNDENVKKLNKLFKQKE